MHSLSETTSFSSDSGRRSAPLPVGVRWLAALLLLALLSLGLSASTLAQSRKAVKAAPAGPGYTTGIGLRAGGPSGLTVKHFFKPQVAVEGILGTNFSRSGLNLTVLVEKHGSAFQSKGLQWYYGLGGHLSTYDGAGYYDWYYDKHGRRRLLDDDYYYYRDRRFWGLGIDGIIGLEYHFTDLPFTLGVDAKPYAELVRRSAYFGTEAAVSLRYAF